MHSSPAQDAEDKGDFYDFDEYERLVGVAHRDPLAHAHVLLVGKRDCCGEMMALRWDDVDLGERQLCVARSEWTGHVTMPKGGRLGRVLKSCVTNTLRVARRSCTSVSAGCSTSCCATTWRASAERRRSTN